MVTEGGSVVSLVDGLAGGANSDGNIPIPAGLIAHRGSPDNAMTGQTGSDVVFDTVNSELYMVEAQGGSEWVHLVSGT